MTRADPLIGKFQSIKEDLDQVAREIHYARSVILKTNDPLQGLANLDQALRILGATDPGVVGLSKYALYHRVEE